MTTRTLSSVVLCIVLGFAAAAQAAPVSVVDFGGTEYLTDDSHPSFSGTVSTTSGLDLDNDSAFDDVRRIRGFNETTPLNPGGSYDTTQTSAVFYGAWQCDRFDQGSWSGGNTNMWLDDAAPGDDQIQFSTNTGTGVTGNLKGLVIWQKANFLAGSASGETVVFDNGSVLSVNVADVGTGSYNFRFVVKNASTYYISEYSVNVNSTSEGTKTLSQLGLTEQVSGKQWAVYSPSNTSIGFSSGTFASVDFNDVEAVGFLMQRGNATGATIYTRITEFSATATVIPEPTTLVLVGLGACGVLLRRRRNR
ncbi:MAG TPA: hypothetical protein DCX07_08465 [Phycisphaerales bacterium]|nr:hypothetical protein [Phycisphaerales bacterium]